MGDWDVPKRQTEPSFRTMLPLRESSMHPCSERRYDEGAKLRRSSYRSIRRQTALTSEQLGEACPYGAISFDSDASNANAFKCTMCIDRLTEGQMPICVSACPMRALDFGPLSALQTKYGTNNALAGMPSGSTSTPAVVFKPHDTKPTLVTLNTNDVLTVMATRSVCTQPATCLLKPNRCHDYSEWPYDEKLAEYEAQHYRRTCTASGGRQLLG